MDLDAQNPATLAILLDRFDRFEKGLAPQMARIEQYLDKVDAHELEIERIKKNESGQNEAIKDLIEFKTITRSSIRNAYWGTSIIVGALTVGATVFEAFFGGKK